MDAEDGGRDEGDRVDIRFPIMSGIALPLAARSTSDLSAGSLSETARLVSEFDGDGGGGIETELGSRARGVTGPFPGRVGVPAGAP